ncbi:signal peptide peptidase SppA [Flavobacteriales bacterium]|nr:signal peptide peptidase SppA [Flavobacteriales bacterium]
MRSFFRTLLASFIAAVIAFIIGGMIVTFIFVGSIGALFEGISVDQVAPSTKVKNNSLVHMNLNSMISERTHTSFNPSNFQVDNLLGIDAIRAGLKAAKADDKIKGIYLDLSGLAVGISTIEEIRQALIDFKKSNKFIIAYSEAYFQSNYYLASVADEMYIYPEGMMDFRGMGAELMFYKPMLDKWGVEMQVIRGSNNKFKSAVEPFLSDHMSDANRAQMETLLGSMWQHLKKGIEHERGISLADLDMIADSALVTSAEDAIEYKMIDGEKYKDEIIDLLKVKMGVESIDDMNILEFNKYAKKTLFKERENGNENGNIAVVYATGSIASGEGDLETIGSEGVSKALRAARLNDSVKAVVFRVNSPGGSALASDVIWREVKLLEETDKPIIVSMGDYAASGGYYISCAADKIYAQANTVTGSIGVFGVIPNLEGFLTNEIGITTDRVETNEYSTLTVTKPLSDKELLLMQESVDEVYDVFKGRVADGREGLDVPGVDSIGQGRVWSGTNALEIGLVDEIGGIQDAIDYAAELVELSEEDRTIIEYPIIEVNQFEALLEQLSEQMEQGNSDNDPGLSIHLMKQLKAIDEMTQMRGIQARLPFKMILK